MPIEESTRYVKIAEDVIDLLPNGLVMEVRRLREENVALKKRILKMQASSFTDEEMDAMFGRTGEIWSNHCERFLAERRPKEE